VLTASPDSAMDGTHNTTGCSNPGRHGGIFDPGCV
jgi:hypothetical protein